MDLKAKLRQLIHELQQPESNKDVVVAEIIRIKEKLGHKIPTPPATKTGKRKSGKKSRD